MKQNKYRVHLILILFWINLTVQLPAEAGIMGIDEPGSTQWPNHWVGSVSDVLLLDYDASPSSISIDSVRGNAYVTFGMHLAPYIRKVSIPDLSISEAIRWNHSLGSLVTSVQMENLDQTMFLSNRSDHSYFIRMSNLNNQIEHISELDYLVAGPLVYSETLRCVFCRNSANNRLIHKYSLDSCEVSNLILDAVDTSVADLIFDDAAGNLYALSSDYPGDVIRVDGDSFQVTNSITLPGYLRCEQGVLDPLNNQLLIKAQGETLASRYLIQVNIEALITELMIQLESDEVFSVLLGVNNSHLYVLVSALTTKVIRFNNNDLSRIDEEYLPHQFGVSVSAKQRDNSIILVNDETPAKVALIECDPFMFLNYSGFQGQEGHFQSIAINRYLNELILACMTSNPASVVLVNLTNFTREGRILFSLNTSGSLTILKADSEGLFTYGFHSGSPSYLVRIRNSDYQIDAFAELEDDLTALEMIIDNPSSKVFLLRNDSVTRYNLETLQFEEKYEFHHPDDNLQCLLHDSTRDQLIACNTSGKAFRLSKNPISILDDTSMSENAGCVTSAVMLPDADKIVFALKKGDSEPANLIEFDISDFEFGAPVETGYLENEILAMTYSVPDRVLSYGVSLSYGGVVSYGIEPLEKINQSIPFSMGRNIRNSIFDTETGSSYWSNSQFSGRIAKSCHTSLGYITGSQVSVGYPVQVNHLAMYSHASEGRIRMALYDRQKQLRWESPELVNNGEEDWVAIPISLGEPPSLSLDPDVYWLVFQADGKGRIASAHQPEPGQGIRQPAVFGSFPDVLWYPEMTSDRWAIYADWDYLYPTVTPTATGSPTQSHAPTVTPTPVVSPSPSPSASQTPAPQPGVDLVLNRNSFQEGDQFLLKANIFIESHPENDLYLWVFLDVAGSYWFGPGWTQDPDWYDPGIEAGSHTETILDFVWPKVSGSAEGLAFWAAVLDSQSMEIIGHYDRVEFQYSSGRN